jgi:hypothetical protein
MPKREALLCKQKRLAIAAPHQQFRKELENAFALLDRVRRDLDCLIVSRNTCPPLATPLAQIIARIRSEIGLGSDSDI